MELYIIRHGESLSNIGGSDDFDCELSPKGKLQAEYLGKYLKDTKFDMIYSSHLCRAVQTAAAVAKYQDGSPEITIVPDFAETGTPIEHEAKIDLHKTFWNNLRYIDTKIGREYGGDIVRIEEAIDKYVIIPAYSNATVIEKNGNNEKRYNPQRILISAHGVANAVMMSCLANFRFDINTNIVQHNTCINKFELFLYNGIQKKRFLRYNDVPHLPDELRLASQF